VSWRKIGWGLDMEDLEKYPREVEEGVAVYIVSRERVDVIVESS
jgi:hypothetical protein